MSFLKHQIAATLILLSACTAWAGTTLEIGAGARMLAFQKETGILAASQTLKGVTFLHLQGGAVPASVTRADWPTLDAVPLSDGRFLLADRFGGLRLVRVVINGTTLEPTQIALWPTDSIPTSLLVQGNMLYLGLGGAGLEVFEWSDQASAPILRGRYPFVDFTKDIAFAAPAIVYLADNLDTGFQVLDVSDPQRPRALAIKPHGFVDTVDNSGWLAAVGDRLRGTALFDCRVPARPVEAAFVPLPPGGNAVMLRSVALDSSGRLLVCESTAGARLLKLSPGPAIQASVLQSYSWPGESANEGIFLDATTIAIATDRGMIHIESAAP